MDSFKGMPYFGGGSRRPRSAGNVDGHVVTSVHLEEHRALMVTVVERVLSAKSGLNEAFSSLLRGFEVCDVVLPIE